MAEQGSAIETTDTHWDCSCTTGYIHPSTDALCPVCGDRRDSADTPDSRVSEVRALGQAHND